MRFVAVFAALIWLSFCCQIVVYGLAWLALRMGAPVAAAPGAAPSRGAGEAWSGQEDQPTG